MILLARAKILFVQCTLFLFVLFYLSLTLSYIIELYIGFAIMGGGFKLSNIFDKCKAENGASLSLEEAAARDADRTAKRRGVEEAQPRSGKSSNFGSAPPPFEVPQLEHGSVVTEVASPQRSLQQHHLTSPAISAGAELPVPPPMLGDETSQLDELSSSVQQQYVPNSFSQQPPVDQSSTVLGALKVSDSVTDRSSSLAAELSDVAGLTSVHEKSQTEYTAAEQRVGQLQVQLQNTVHAKDQLKEHVDRLSSLLNMSVWAIINLKSNESDFWMQLRERIIRDPVDFAKKFKDVTEEQVLELETKRFKSLPCQTKSVCYKRSLKTPTVLYA